MERKQYEDRDRPRALPRLSHTDFVNVLKGGTRL